MTENAINGGWYGWIGNHRVAGMYDPAMDAAFLRRHHINWYWLGHQWVVPFLVADLADVRQTMLAESRRARIWVELYWWGDHSTWEGFTGMDYPGLYARLKQTGIPAGGDDLTGKDWFAIAEDPRLMQSVKKTIRWQLDTISQHLGTNTVYGVLLSEEEPDHGINVTVGQTGQPRYNADPAATRRLLARVHNELYDYVKSLYPHLKVSPGFYPRWVEPGTLKLDAVVMDNYPYFGLEREKFREWQTAYGAAPEQFVLLWGYGHLDYRLELTRLQKTVQLHLDHGLKNLGFFRPELALRDPIFRLFATRGVGDYAPYDLEQHRQSVAALAAETRQTDNTFREPNLARLHSRAALCRQADRLYAFRKKQLDAAYAQIVRARQWLDLARLITLAEAEGWLPAGSASAAIPDAKQLAAWETLSKEFRTLPQFHAALAPREQQVRALARQLAAASTLPGLAADLRAGRYTAAHQRAAAARQRLVRARAEKSWEVLLQLGNRYGYPLTVAVTLTADYGDGQSHEIYRGVPFEASQEPSRAFTFYLPRPPAALTLATGPWSGDLAVQTLRVGNSRQTLAPRALQDDHVTGAAEFVADPAAGFILVPWASTAAATVRY